MSSNKNDDDDDDDYMTKIENNRMSDATDSKRIRSVSLYRLKDIGGVVGNKDDNFGGDSDGSGELRKRGKRRSGPRPYHLLFLVLYVYQGIRVLSTVGGKFTFVDNDVPIKYMNVCVLVFYRILLFLFFHLISTCVMML